MTSLVVTYYYSGKFVTHFIEVRVGIYLAEGHSADQVAEGRLTDEIVRSIDRFNDE